MQDSISEMEENIPCFTVLVFTCCGASKSRCDAFLLFSFLFFSFNKFLISGDNDHIRPYTSITIMTIY